MRWSDLIWNYAVSVRKSYFAHFSISRQTLCLKCVQRWVFTQASISAPTCRWSSFFIFLFLILLQSKCWHPSQHAGDHLVGFPQLVEVPQPLEKWIHFCFWGFFILKENRNMLLSVWYAILSYFKTRILASRLLNEISSCTLSFLSHEHSELLPHHQVLPGGSQSIPRWMAWQQVQCGRLKRPGRRSTSKTFRTTGWS